MMMKQYLDCVSGYMNTHVIALHRNTHIHTQTQK